WNARLLLQMDTARRVVDNALKETAQRTRQILDSTQEAFIASDVHVRIVDWNPQAENLFGYKKDEIIGKRLIDTIVPPHRKETHLKRLEYIAQHGYGDIKKRIESSVLTKDGREFPVELALFPVTFLGHVTLCAFLHDITERQRAEKAVKESEEKFRLLVQGVRDYAIFLLDPDGNVASWNRGAERIKQYTSDEIVGKHFSIFYAPEDVQAGKPA